LICEARVGGTGQPPPLYKTTNKRKIQISAK
jgi:hypothetical protein